MRYPNDISVKSPVHRVLQPPGSFKSQKKIITLARLACLCYFFRGRLYTGYDGSHFAKLTSVIEHLSSKFMLNMSFLLLPVMFKHKG